MGKKYSKKYILDELHKALITVDTLYTRGFINYTGITMDTGELYSEVIAKELCGHIKDLNKIQKIVRKESYKTKSHCGITKSIDSNRKEENLALNMFEHEYENIGKIIDYQIPIKNVRGNKAGKVDILSNINNDLILIELKVDKNKDTLLRCVLEIYTYYKQLDLDKLRIDFIRYCSSIRKAVLVPCDSSQHNEYINNPFVRNLTNKLKIEIFTFSEYMKIAKLYID